MCLSMHQPWASLLVHGFKRFEGREWTHKYRGPLWIHATAQKCSQEFIEELEGKYRAFYQAVGEDLPEFPTRYPNSVLLGRVDLIDVITLQEYQDTVPKALQEPTECQYQFVVRNPQILELPLKMSGQPNLYKLEKGLHFGVRTLLRKVPYSWWPPKEYRLYQLGRFDLYPMSAADVDSNKLLGKLSDQRSPSCTKTNVGCYHVKSMLSLREQQAVIESIRRLCITEPQRFKFSRCETLAAEEEAATDEDERAFDYLKPS